MTSDHCQSHDAKYLPFGSFGKCPVVNDVRFNGNFFFRAKSADGDPFLDHGVRHGQVGIILVTVKRIKFFRGGAVELEQFFKQPDADLPLALQKQDCRALAAQHRN